MNKNIAIENIRNCLRSIGWLANYDERGNFFSTGVRSQSNLVDHFRIVVDASVEGFVLIYAILPLNGANAVPELSRLITGINYGVINGNFEMNQRAGEIRYKICLAYMGLDRLPPELITDSVFRACKMVDGHIARILEVLATTQGRSRAGTQN